MSFQDDIRTQLATSAALVAAFTGGIVVYDALGGLGLNRNTYPTGFDSTGFMKPIIVIRERDIVPTPAIHDEVTQETSFMQAVQIVFYTDRKDGWSVLETGQATVYGLLADKVIGKRVLRLRNHGRMERDRLADNACIVYSVYDGHGIYSPAST